MNDEGNSVWSGTENTIRPASAPGPSNPVVGDVPTIGQPTSLWSTPPTGPPVIAGGPTQPLPRRRRGGTVALTIAGVLAVVVAGTALFAVLGGRGEPEPAAEPTTTVTQQPPTDPSSSTTTEVPPPQPPTVVIPTVPTTTDPTHTSATTPANSPGYGAYVAVVWSDRLSNIDSAEIQRMATEKQSQYGVPTAVVYGDDYRSLRDGTVAVVYAGGFDSPRSAARWCWDRGERGTSCFGVGLNDDYTENDRKGTGRMYVNEI